MRVLRALACFVQVGGVNVWALASRPTPVEVVQQVLDKANKASFSVVPSEQPLFFFESEPSGLFVLVPVAGVSSVAAEGGGTISMAPESIIFDAQKHTSCVLLTMFLAGDEHALARAREDMHLQDACTFDEWLVVSYRPHAETVTCFKDLGLMVQVRACLHLLLLLLLHTCTCIPQRQHPVTCAPPAPPSSQPHTLPYNHAACLRGCLSSCVAGCTPGEHEPSSAT
jgi:hypothetical protein